VNASQISPDRTEDEPLLTPRFLLLLGVQLAFGYSFSVFFLLPKFLAVELGMGPELIGRVTAMTGATAALSVPAVGTFIDRSARRRLIVFGTVISGFAAFGFRYVDHSGPLLFVLRAIQGAAFTLVFNSVLTLAADLAPRRRLSQALSIIGVAAVSMNAIAPAVSEPLAERAGWPAVFAAAGCAALLAGGLAALFREQRLVAPARASFKHLASARNLGVFHVVAIAGGAFGALFTFVPPLALELGLTRVSGFFVAFTSAVVGVRLLFGGVADRWGRRKVATAALGLYAMATLSAALLRPGWLEVLGGVFGVAHGLFYPALNAFAVEHAAPEGRGSLMTFFNGAFNAGLTLSVLGLGMLAQAMSYAAAFVTIGALAVSAVLTLALIPAESPAGPPSTRVT
jgi:MFS family permease